MIRLRPGALSRVCRTTGLSREALARRSGVSASTLYRVDRADSAPGNRLIGLLVDVSGEQFDDLFEIVGPDRAPDGRPGPGPGPRPGAAPLSAEGDPDPGPTTGAIGSDAR